MQGQERIALTTEDGVRLSAVVYDGMRYDGRHNATRAAGGRDLAMLVAHGFTGSSRTPAVKRIAVAFADAGASVLSIDFRGHGRSGGRCTAGDLEVLDVAAGVAWLRAQGYLHIVTLGWSMGGSAVLRYAGLGGDADAVVSVSSPGTWFERGTRSMRVVHWLCETRSGRLTCRVVRGTRLANEGWLETPLAPAEVVGNISPRPLLLVHGDNDHYFPRHHIESLVAAAPNADVWIEPGMGHAETATSPELVARIDAWVRSVLETSPVCDDGVRD